jgi:L-alanine-DL-glutamate epimerase-like enolase superfamily enzyme
MIQQLKCLVPTLNDGGGETLDQPVIVRCEDDGGFVGAGECAYEGGNFVAGFGVQIACGFIG